MGRFSRNYPPITHSPQDKMAPIEWNVIVYDKPGTDRSKVRPEHVAAIPATVNAGIVNSAGAIYKDVEKTQFAGSTFHLMAESREDVLEFLKKDIYYKAGIGTWIRLLPIQWELQSDLVSPCQEWIELEAMCALDVSYCVRTGTICFSGSGDWL